MVINYVNYCIWFSDLAEFNAAVAAYGPGYAKCPFTASQEFGLTWPPPGGPEFIGTKGMFTQSSFSIGLGLGDEIYYPLPSGQFMSSFVDSIPVNDQTGNPPYMVVGPPTEFTWWARFTFVGTDDPVTLLPPTTPLPTRRWIAGLEIPNNLQGEGQVSSGSLLSCREASRTMDGKGWAIRGSNGGGTYMIRSTTTLSGGAAPQTSWERFYIRLNVLGSNDLAVWRCRSKSAPLVNAGAILKIDTAGNLVVYSNSNVNAETLLGTSLNVVNLNQWHRIDILLKYSDAHPAHNGHIRVYKDGQIELDLADGTANGLDNHDLHGESYLGQYSAAENFWDVDLDDWMCSDVPNNLGVESLDSLDWFVGSHCKLVNMVSATGVDWTILGAIEGLDGGWDAADISLTVQYLKSSTASAEIVELTNAVDNPLEPGLWFGAASALGMSHNLSAIASVGSTQISVGGAAYVSRATNEVNAFLWDIVGYSSGGDFPATILPLYIKRVKSANANESYTFYMAALVEYIGVWGAEDNVFALGYSFIANILQHNARYPNTPWAFYYGGAFTAPCFAIGGTYVGNDTVTTLTFPAPVHFLWIRAVSAAVQNGVIWHAAGLGGNEGPNTNVTSYGVVSVISDEIGITTVTIVGNEASSNKNGVTYQYIVFCDPGSRFNYCGAYNPNSNVATKTILKFDPNFIPEAGFIQKTEYGLAGANLSLSYKGAGNGANDGQLTAGTAKANWGTFGGPTFTVRADNISATRGEYNFSLWRQLDPLAFCMVQITSYVGDGGAFKIVNLPNITGLWPLLAVVIPHGATGYFRDPSHTANNSCQINNNTQNSTTAIIAGGPDTIYVGLTLNTLGTVYEVFVILGDDDGWNNGTFWPPNIISSAPYQLPPYNPVTDPNITMLGGMDFNGDAGLLTVLNLGGIYTLVPNKTDDTVYTGYAGATALLEIPDPTFKTGYIGG